MTEWPTFPPKTGLTEEEQRKVESYIKTHGVTPCPSVGSPELAALNTKKTWAWLEALKESVKVKWGFVPLKHPDRTEKERKEHKRKSEREWRMKRKEKRDGKSK